MWRSWRGDQVGAFAGIGALVGALASGPVACSGGSTPGGSGGAGGETGSTTSPSGTGGTAGSGSGGYGGAGSGTGGEGAGDLGKGALVDRDLLVRYFIDEGGSGAATGTLADAALDPLPLAVTGSSALSFVTEGGHRGFGWNVSGDSGRASVAVPGSKLEARLNGSQQGTIEVVVDIDAVVSQSSRISHIGFDEQSGSFSLTSNSTSRLQFRWNNSILAGSWPVALPALGRAVVHVVLDTTQEDPEARLRLYVNASPMPRVSGAVPTQDALVALVPDTHYVLGNREVGLRSFKGSMFYAAMYTAALSTEEVLHNTALLLVNDDTPSSTP
ncbi:LamG-like jellyroll fold domain-containing protein [Chondromyces apiculatus]|uniref:EBNA-1 protein n=1 Tax=Chondromyces apiculatus DSM 436 TaxID=1192034 RepID=A0A017T6G1_9BACT|nr:LamG-like jellyroll fold domain-containing protein [Chondromyces apiculatus]EYF04858.1 EBNA-1 protein [Chondromyces apiculatus DSM 436]